MLEKQVHPVRGGEIQGSCGTYLPSASRPAVGWTSIHSDEDETAASASSVAASPKHSFQLLGDAALIVIGRVAIARLERAAERMKSE